MKQWLMVGCLVIGVGCGGDLGPTPRSCTQLGWACGVDDYGRSCGTCSGGRSCNGNGVCIGSGVCTPVCGGRTCGADPVCGTSCGTCPTGQTCNGFGSCITNGPTCSCNGATCGVDNCGRSCGTCTGGRTCSSGVCITPATVPVDHRIATATAPLFSNFYGVPFTVPAALVSYAAQSTADTFDVAVFTVDNWAIYSSGSTGSVAYLSHARTALASDAGNLPAGNYVLGFYCRNIVQRCSVSYSLGAQY